MLPEPGDIARWHRHRVWGGDLRSGQDKTLLWALHFKVLLCCSPARLLPGWEELSFQGKETSESRGHIYTQAPCPAPGVYISLAFPTHVEEVYLPGPDRTFPLDLSTRGQHRSLESRGDQSHLQKGLGLVADRA